MSGIVELDGTQGAGARMIASIVDSDPDTVAVGDKVQIAFDRVSDTYAVPTSASSRRSPGSRKPRFQFRSRVFGEGLVEDLPRSS